MLQMSGIASYMDELLGIGNHFQPCHEHLQSVNAYIDCLWFLAKLVCQMW